MLPITNDVISNFESNLRQKEIDSALLADYKKWLRYFNDFCGKYSVSDSTPERIKLFLEKLRSKRQSEAQCIQAAHAISVYIEMQSQNTLLDI